MYSLIKAFAKNLFGERLLLEMEFPLRKIIGLFYFGNAVYCPICKQRFRRFIHYQNGELLCPSCGSLARKRFLFTLIRHLSPSLPHAPMILHFTPHRAIARALTREHGDRYVISDYGNRKANKQFDIRDISSEDCTYDLVICYHVLEHIDRDRDAMKELYRITKPGGILLTQVPFGAGPTHEDDQITSPKARLAAFGQEDHVRIYGFEDFCNRLHSTGFSISIHRPTDPFSTMEINQMGLNSEERVVVCRK